MAHEQTYAVQEGDTLSGIAEDQLGDAFTITNPWQSSGIAAWPGGRGGGAQV